MLLAILHVIPSADDPRPAGGLDQGEDPACAAVGRKP
jgi:hypothetical protein